jgi:hypothetical protein
MDFNAVLHKKLFQATLSFPQYVHVRQQWSDAQQAAWG